MNGFRFSAAIVAALACLALTAAAQGTPAVDAKKMDAPKADAKKADPKKAEPKKAEPKKAEPKKAAPRKAPPKKVDSKVQPTAAGGTVQKYEAGKAPDLKDSKGGTVSTSPDAYDLSSATAPAKKKK